MFEELFQRRKVNAHKLLSYGFHKEGQYRYSVEILNGGFTLSVFLDESGRVNTTLTEKETNEPYVLYKTDAAGAFVGEVRAAVEAVLRDISEKCCEFSVFKQKQTLMLIDHIREKYGDEPEYLWKRFPDNAVWRRKDTQKWYAAVLTVQRAKLGLPSEKTAEIIDFRIEPEKIMNLIDGKTYFPGWHMNKKHWVTVILDGSVPFEELCRRIDDSYRIAGKK